MKYGISAAGIVVQEGRVLLVRHHKPGQAAAGWGLEGEESIPACTVREVREETGLVVEPGGLAYVEEFIENRDGAGFHFCAFFVVCERVGGDLSLKGRTVDERDTLIEARFFAREELAGPTLFRAILHDAFWADLAAGFSRTRYLGLHRPEFS